MFFGSSKSRRLEEIENKLNLIEKSLLASFRNIKLDINSSKNTSQYRLIEVLRRLERLESEVFSLKDKTNLIEHHETSQQDEAPVDSFKDSKENDIGIAGKITEVQQNILVLLSKLHIENPDSWIPAKQLAEELYPDKRYESIRPMISTYLDVLEELNLVRKLRKRRQVFTKLTKKGISHIKPKLKQTIKVKKSRK